MFFLLPKQIIVTLVYQYIQVLQTGSLSAGEQQIFLPDQFVLIAFDVCMLYIVNF